MNEFDIGIIGGGPAGYTAALHAGTEGFSVVMFEKDAVGGTCLNRGCIPTKAILHSSEMFDEMKNSEKLGIFAENVQVDWQKVITRKDNIVQKLRKSLELTLKNSGVVTVNQEASIESENIIKTDDGETYACKKIFVATGAKPRVIKGLEFDHKFLISSDDVLNLPELPKSIAIVGSGAIGIEWARIFSNFGVEVSVVEMAEHLLPLADIEVSKRVERIFKTKKIKTYLNNSIEKIEGKKAVLKSGEILEPDCILVAVGRQRLTENIEGAKLLGDAYGSIQLAHFASKQAISEIKGIKFDQTLVPSVVYGTPEIAWIGKREQDLEEGTYERANLLVSALGKSHCDECTEGFIKILSQNGKIVGAHIVSKEASAIVQQILIAIQNNVSVEKLKETCFAHPTYSEGIFECLFKI